MADLTQTGPNTTTRVESSRPSHVIDTALSGLTVAPSYVAAEAPRMPTHTSESVQQRWTKRTFDTGTIIEGKNLGRSR
ncbi:MAG: hypothetical protein RL518_2639 [Pseudomonadota bacterium]|jgi:hypothetical protein